jgi:hypothetical protein
MRLIGGSWHPTALASVVGVTDTARLSLVMSNATPGLRHLIRSLPWLPELGCCHVPVLVLAVRAKRCTDQGYRGQ